MTDKSRPPNGRAVIRVDIPGTTETRRPQRRYHSSDRLSRDGSRSPVGLQVAIKRQPEVCACVCV